MEDWRAENFWLAIASEWVLRETVMSTIEPDDIEGGRRMEGNSIWSVVSIAQLFGRRLAVERFRREDVPGVYLQ